MVTALEMFRLDRASAEEFLEIYKGVVAEYPSMVSQLTSGSCIALEVTCADGEDAYKRFRDFVGPPDPVSRRFCSEEHSYPVEQTPRSTNVPYNELRRDLGYLGCAKRWDRK